jgi:exonuclease III
MKSHLDILSLNINGLRDNERRKRVFSWLKNLSYDIILLQDIHYEENDDTLWSLEWGLPALWSPHNAILSMNQSLSLSKVDSDSLLERCLLGKVSYQGAQNDIIICSIYVPADRKRRRQFLLDLPNQLHPDLSILGGDFNTIADPSIDYFPSKEGRSSKDWDILSNSMLLWNLCDLHTEYSEREAQITHWQKTQNGVVGSRIDYIFVSSHISQLFTTTAVQPCPFSDHLGVTTKMKLSLIIPRGKGIWKLNSSILKSQVISKSIKEILTSSLKEIDQGKSDPSIIWEEAKSLIQAVSIFYSQKFARKKRIEEKYLEDKLLENSILYQEGKITSQEWEQVSILIKKDLQELTQRSTEEYQVRSKLRWLEKGEKPSRYFHQLMSARQTHSSIYRLKCQDGSLTSSTDGILSEARSFYQDLYSKGSIDERSQDEILQYVQSSLSQDQQNELDQPISLEEVLSTIRNTKSFSSPGKDGLSYEFYKSFKSDIAPILVQLYNKIFQGSQFNTSALECIIILICKYKGNEEDLKYWHPISLLNCDIKILTKILASRLQRHISTLIHFDQSGFISGRWIQDNCMLLDQILEFNRIHPIMGGLYFLDQEKAYDRVDWSYLIKCLQRFGFSKS